MKNMKARIWVDDIRPMPKEYNMHLRTVDEVISAIEYMEAKQHYSIEVISLDHDAGDFAKYGGDYIKILDWLEEKQVVDGWQIDWLFNIHSQNPIGVEKMEQIIRKNGWRML